MKLRKEVKLVLKVLLGLLLLLVIIYSIYKKKNYEVEYNVDGYTIVENYDKNDKLYTFTIKDGNFKYSFISNEKYNRKHKLINGIKEYETESEKCIKIVSDKISYNYLCHNEETALDYRLTSDEMLEKLDYEKPKKDESKYNNLEVYNTLDYTFLIWNYTGFEFINDDSEKTIDVVDKDQYEIPITTIIDKYLIMADYNSKYNFNNFYIIDLEKGTKSEMKTKYDISFDSYFVGTKEDSVYLVDKKNKVEYEIVPKKKKIRIVGTSNKKGVIYTEDGLEKISLTKLINDDKTFYDDSKYRYEVIDDKLYQIINGNKLLVSTKYITDIVYKNDDTILYLINDALYLYNIKYGEIKVMSDFEWNFNYKNLIYLYIP